MHERRSELRVPPFALRSSSGGATRVGESRRPPVARVLGWVSLAAASASSAFLDAFRLRILARRCAARLVGLLAASKK